MIGAKEFLKISENSLIVWFPQLELTMHVIDLFIDRDGSCIIFTIGFLSTKLLKNPAVNN